jgi:hypothetical protein
VVQEDLFFDGFSYGQDDIECAVLFGELNDDVVRANEKEDQGEELLDFLKNLV